MACTQQQDPQDRQSPMPYGQMPYNQMPPRPGMTYPTYPPQPTQPGVTYPTYPTYPGYGQYPETYRPLVPGYPPDYMTTYPTYPGYSRGPLMPPDVGFEEGPPTTTDIGYLPAYMKTQIGRRVKIEFLIGTDLFVDRDGTLLDVGINYVILREAETDDLLLCDLYSIKFVRFYY